MFWRFSAATSLILLFAAPTVAEDDIAAVPSKDLRAGGNPQQRYFLIGPDAGDKAPAGGYGLVLILPGGDGSDEFHPFCKRIYKHGLPAGYLAAELVAVKWTPNQQVVWPTAASRTAGQQFTTEQFIAAVVADVSKQAPIDRRRVFTLTWSSSGPAGYAASAAANTPVTGSFIAMSVFKPQFLSRPAAAKGQAYYLYHSPEDRVCPPRMAEQARALLTRSGGKVELATYAGGHGWTSPTLFQDIKRGVEWLAQTAVSKPPAGSRPAQIRSATKPKANGS